MRREQISTQSISNLFSFLEANASGIYNFLSIFTFRHAIPLHFVSILNYHENTLSVIPIYSPRILFIHRL